MAQFSAIPASTANSTAFLLSTGSEPGIPRHTGQTFVFGGFPKRAEQEQKILLAVRSWTCTSRPMTGSYFARAATVESGVVTISSDYTPASHALPQTGSHENSSRASGTNRGGLPPPAVPKGQEVGIGPLAGLAGRCCDLLFLEINLEVQQVVPLGVAHARHIEAPACKGRGDSAHIEEHESRLGRVRFHRLGAELRAINFVERLLTYGSLHLGARKRQRVHSPRRDMRQPPVKIIVGGGSALVGGAGGGLRLHARQ